MDEDADLARIAQMVKCACMDHTSSAVSSHQVKVESFYSLCL